MTLVSFLLAPGRGCALPNRPAKREAYLEMSGRWVHTYTTKTGWTSEGKTEWQTYLVKDDNIEITATKDKASIRRWTDYLQYNVESIQWNSTTGTIQATFSTPDDSGWMMQSTFKLISPEILHESWKSSYPGKPKLDSYGEKWYLKDEDLKVFMKRQLGMQLP